MTGRSPARLLAPLALATSVVALILVVTSPGTDTERSPSATQTGRSRPAGSSTRSTGRTSRSRQPRTYTVKPGDTPSAIAERTGVPLDRLLELNPDLDPQLLSPGQRIKLRQ